MANGQNIDYSEKENGPRASYAPALGLNAIIFKHVYRYMQQISGERLQDHWSSGSLSVIFQYIEIFKFFRIDVDTMDIKYEIINVICFRDFLDTLFTLHGLCP